MDNLILFTSQPDDYTQPKLRSKYDQIVFMIWQNFQEKIKARKGSTVVSKKYQVQLTINQDQFPEFKEGELKRRLVHVFKNWGWRCTSPSVVHVMIEEEDYLIVEFYYACIPMPGALP